MAKKKTLAERGEFKMKIHSALYKSADIKDLILGDISKMTSKEVRDAFKDHVKSHLFVDDTIKETTTYIFYDVVFPVIHTNIKTCQIILYAICHRDILDTYEKEGFYGDRADILSQMIENSLLNDENVLMDFGVGALDLVNVDIYNSTRFYGTIMTFEVPNFRGR